MSKNNHTFLTEEADAIEGQILKTERLVLQKANYQKLTLNKDKSHFYVLKKLEMSKKSHQQLMNYCKTKNVLFLSIPFDINSIMNFKIKTINSIKITSNKYAL